MTYALRANFSLRARRQNPRRTTRGHVWRDLLLTRRVVGTANAILDLVHHATDKLAGRGAKVFVLHHHEFLLHLLHNLLRHCGRVRRLLVVICDVVVAMDANLQEVAQELLVLALRHGFLQLVRRSHAFHILEKLRAFWLTFASLLGSSTPGISTRCG